MFQAPKALPAGCDCDECSWDSMRADAQRLVRVLDKLFARIAISRGAEQVDPNRSVFSLREGARLTRPERWTWRSGHLRQLLLLGTAEEIRTILCGYEAELERLQFELGLRNALALVTVVRHGCEVAKRFDIRTERGPAHTLLLSFDLERWLPAVHARCGLDPRDWPRPLRRELADDEPHAAAPFAQ